ncbi:MAG: hypothetical protein EXR29_14425 [Betaproteobacteria bacterium]|nr:hypothetical protein [Betaproteobacteria bacterium]
MVNKLRKDDHAKQSRSHCPPTLWGLGSFGEAGVNRVLEILQGELKLVMGNCGTQKLTDINRDYVTSRNWRI